MNFSIGESMPPPKYQSEEIIVPLGAEGTYVFVQQSVAIQGGRQVLGWRSLAR